MGKINIHEMLGKDIAKPKSKKTINELKTQEIKLENIKFAPKKEKKTGVKKNIYFDSETWEIIEKVKEKKGYKSYSETIQNLIKAHKR